MLEGVDRDVRDKIGHRQSEGKHWLLQAQSMAADAVVAAQAGAEAEAGGGGGAAAAAHSDSKCQQPPHMSAAQYIARAGGAVANGIFCWQTPNWVVAGLPFTSRVHFWPSCMLACVEAMLPLGIPFHNSRQPGSEHSSEGGAQPASCRGSAAVAP